MRSRTYEHPRDLQTMQDLVSRTWTLDSHWHIGGLAWSRLHHVGREPDWPTRIWEDRGSVVAWGWYRPPGELELCVDPTYPELFDEVLDWFESEATGEWLTVTLTAPSQRLERRGYEPVDPGAFFIHHSRDLASIPSPRIPSGYTIRSVLGMQDVERRVAAHRSAFAPSQVNEESYRNVMQAWSYRTDLDVVAVGPDGSFASFCLIWFDQRNRVGELEPVGTHPDHRRRGLGSAVCLDALGRLRGLGATSAIVCARGDPAYPVPSRLYASIGFSEHARNITYRAPRRR